jgi:hypothetical protein
MPSPREPGAAAGLDLRREVAMTPMSQMTSERQIWEAAVLLVRRHGGDAPSVAGREALKYCRRSDELSYVVWSWIARATAELIKPEPGIAERIH